jgi:hypothetical protein
MSDHPTFLHWSHRAFEQDRLIQILPELDALRDVVERNDWHDDDVLQQSLRLFCWVKALPISLLAIIDVPEAPLHALLAAIVDDERREYTLHDLLTFTALIHDVGKAMTFQRHPNGTTRCPEHEAVGAAMAPAICQRFDFTSAETRCITTHVAAHGEPYTLFKAIASLPKAVQQVWIRRFEVDHRDHLSSVLMLATGDMVTSQLMTHQPEKYAAVLGFYGCWLQRIVYEKHKQMAGGGPDDAGR